MNRQIRSWVLYDFANSLVYITISFYFGLYFVDTLGFSDAWISTVSVVSTFALLFLLPRLGVTADTLGLHKRYLTASTTLISISAVVLGLLMSAFSSGTMLALWSILIVYFLFQAFFQAALAFYSSFLKAIAIGVEDKIAGIGNGLGQLGNLAGLVIGFIIVTKQFHISFISPVSTTFIVSAILFLTLYYFLQKGLIQNAAGTNGLSLKLSLTESLRKVRKNKNVFYYLIAFLLYSDSVLTLNLFVSLYARKAGGLDDSAITTLGLIGLAAGAAGAFLTPWLNKKIGNLKKALILYVGSFGSFLILFALCRTYLQFLVCLLFVGLLFGLLFSASLSMYARLIPKKAEAEYFGFYVLFSRFASIIGPPVWSLTAYIFLATGDNRYRFSVLALAVLVFLSLYFIRKVKEEYTT